MQDELARKLELSGWSSLSPRVYEHRYSLFTHQLQSQTDMQLCLSSAPSRMCSVGVGPANPV